MSVTTRYARLFTLRMLHPYFGSGRAENLRLHPTSNTTRLMKSGRMLPRQTPTGLTVLYEVRNDAHAPFVALPTPFTLTFAIKSQSPKAFSNITAPAAPDADLVPGSPLFFFEATAALSDEPLEAAPQRLDTIRASRFSFVFREPGNSSPRSFVLFDASDTPVSAGRNAAGEPYPETVLLEPDSEGNLRLAVSLTGRAPARYRIEIRDAGDDSLLYHERFFADDALAASPPAGIVQLSFPLYPQAVAPDADPPSAPAFDLLFEPRSAFWRYYVVNRSGKLIVQGGSLDEIAVSPLPASQLPEGITFTRLPDAGVNPIDGFDTVIFRSTHPIPFRERPFPFIRLTHEGTEVISHLPNASSGALLKRFDTAEEAEIYFYI